MDDTEYIITLQKLFLKHEKRVDELEVNFQKLEKRVTKLECYVKAQSKELIDILVRRDDFLVHMVNAQQRSTRNLKSRLTSINKIEPFRLNDRTSEIVSDTEGD